MTYLSSEQSKHSGNPIELYKFEGTYANFYYTTGSAEVVFEGDTYEVLRGLKRGNVNDTTETDDSGELTIDMPITAPLVPVYGFQISPPQLELTIYRGHGTAGPFIQYWQGPVENIKVEKGTATLRVPSALAAAMNADFPNVYFQNPCNHTLGDARCKVDLELWSQATTVTEVSGRNITVASIGTLDGNLLGGDAILSSGERRMIVAQSANVLTLNYPFAVVSADDSITVMAGCDNAWQGDCKNKFANTANFGGFPLIPIKNIFESGLEPGKDVADLACLPTLFDGVYWSILVSIDGISQTLPWLNIGGPAGNGSVQPNPGGRIIRPGGGAFGGLEGFTNTIYELNTPDPYDNLNGQILERGYIIDNTHFRRDFYYPFVPAGRWTAQIQYSWFSQLNPRTSTLTFNVAGSQATGPITKLWPYNFSVTTS